MKVKIQWFYELKGKPTGTIVVIDVYGATTNIPMILSKGPKSLVVVNERNLRKAQQTYEESILVGESDNLPRKVFKASNHPANINSAKLSGKNVLWMSDNGSRVFEAVAVRKKRRVFSCSFNNITALSRWLKKDKGERKITIVISGSKGIPADEDRLCGELLKKLLLGKEYNWGKIRKDVTNFMDGHPGYKGKHKKDMKFILDLGRFKSVPICFKKENGFLEIKDCLQ